MSEGPAPDPACTVRARGERDGVVRLHSRNHTLMAEGQSSFHPKSTHPSALDYLLAALASDLVAGLGREASRTGTGLDAVEVTLNGHLENPLASLGVVGESGSARLSEVRGTLYVSSDAPEPTLHELWERALAKAPVYATLARSAAIHVQLKCIP